MKKHKTTILGLLITAVFDLYSTTVQSQTQKISLAHDSIELTSSDSIISHTGDRFSGELLYRSFIFDIKINYEGGSRTRKVRYEKNGRMISEYHFKEGKFHGPFNEWSSLGKPRRSGSYYEGREDGHWVFYYFNGAKECEGAFVADSTKLLNDFTIRTEIISIDPPYDEFDYTRGYPKHSPPHGEWYFYDKKGELIKTLIFEYGLLKGIEMAKDNGDLFYDY